MSITRLEPEERLSGAVIYNGLIHLAGQVADDPSLDAQGQMEDILRQVDALLAQAGTDKSRMISVQIFLADMNDMAGMNRASASYTHLRAHETVLDPVCLLALAKKHD